MNLETTRALAALLLLGLPLVAGSIAGFPAGFAELPASAFHLDLPQYSPFVYALFTVAMAGIIALYLFPRALGFNGAGDSDFRAFEWAFAPRAGHRFPAWGWLGAGLIGVAWPLAWLHPDWLGPAADHTFVPLWLGYVLTVDGLVFWRAGASPLTRYRWVWLAWFPASALAWWYFELLNRFIQNWLYIGVEDFSTPRYVLGSTAAFSTVIPAVLTTASLLSTFQGFRRRFLLSARRRAADHSRNGGNAWWIAVAAGGGGLVLMPWYPITLFPLIWLAPWLILVGLLERAGLATGVGHMLRGDWGPAATLAAAAVVCGFFWELWNFYSMPKWVYQIPWVNRFKLFEMPIVGYLGYLPFGPACWAFWLLIGPGRIRRGSHRIAAGVQSRA